MFKGTPELIAQRREEIIRACEHLYQTKNFKDITLKDISAATSFSRPTIYNYFETKEEIFLALFEQEYDLWNAQLEKILNDNDSLDRNRLASLIADSLAERMQLLKLLSMNNYDMEAHSRPELLASFKRAYGRSMELMRSLLEKFCTEMDEADREKLIYIFFPFMFGIYPYAEVTEKQKAAMEKAGVNYTYFTVYEIAYRCLIRLLVK